jgi:hypothetical protein
VLALGGVELCEEVQQEDCQVYLARIGTKLKILEVRTSFSSLRPLEGENKLG